MSCSHSDQYHLSSGWTILHCQISSADGPELFISDRQINSRSRCLFIHWMAVIAVETQGETPQCFASENLHLSRTRPFCFTGSLLRKCKSDKLQFLIRNRQSKLPKGRLPRRSINNKIPYDTIQHSTMFEQPRYCSANSTENETTCVWKSSEVASLCSPLQ